MVYSYLYQWKVSPSKCREASGGQTQINIYILFLLKVSHNLRFRFVRKAQ